MEIIQVSFILMIGSFELFYASETCKYEFNYRLEKVRANCKLEGPDLMATSEAISKESANVRSLLQNSRNRDKKLKALEASRDKLLETVSTLLTDVRILGALIQNGRGNETLQRKRGRTSPSKTKPTKTGKLRRERSSICVSLCPDEFTQFRCSCYKPMVEDLSWKEAHNSCQSQGSSLVEIDSQEENDFLTNFLKQNEDFFGAELGFWAGAIDNGHLTTHKWTWNAGPLEITYTNWTMGEPNYIPASMQQCLHFLRSYRNQHFNYMWNDAPCQLPMNYVCEINVKS